MWQKIKILIWKSFQLRKRYWLSTIVEIIVPCFLFFVLGYEFNYESETNNVYTTIPSIVSEQTLYNDFTRKSSHSCYFIYTPNTSIAGEIMKIVTKNLNILPENIESADSENEMIYKFKNKLNENSSFPDDAIRFGIVFKNINLSRYFVYKIRNTQNNWSSDLKQLNKPGPKDFGSVYFEKGFLLLQLTLDKAFITLSVPNGLSPNLADYNLAIQSFPYRINTNTLKYKLNFIIFCYFATFIGFILMFSNTIEMVAEEKYSGMRQRMKVMGLQSWMLWTGWTLHNFFAHSISITVITFISCFELSSLILFNYSDPILFWIFLTMYVIAATYFCYGISGFFVRPLFALIVGNGVWCITMLLPIFSLNASIILQALTMLCPNSGIFHAYLTISDLETQSLGLRFSTLFITGESSTFSMAFILFMFCIDCLLYGFIAWYLESVLPGKYSVAKPLDFFCNWSKKKTDSMEIMSFKKENSRLFEKPPIGYEVGISLKNLYKRFGSVYAINGVDLELYKGQITALLGHNGAGKTTTMSIITGLISPTHGSVKVYGSDIFSEAGKYKNKVGFCPQENLLFPWLTTLDHLIFFGMLKGMSLKMAKSEGLRIIELLNTLQYKNELEMNLSGGMKRKLSLAIALIGESGILIVDEPTSGMDPESRREMWDLILALRGERTILITTHFMEEADVLGDRIAIMNHGQIICYGTSLFLKKAYGFGYNLIINKTESCKESNLITAITNIVPEAKIQISLNAQIIINLPNEKTDQFPELFKMLEVNRKQLCINGISISRTTLEEVFLRAANVQNIEDLLTLQLPANAGNYQLIITKQTDCDTDQVTDFVKQYVPEYLLIANTETKIIYNLPAEKIQSFVHLLAALEMQKQNFNLNSVKITNPTTGDIYPNLSTAGVDGDESKQLPNNDVKRISMPNDISKNYFLKNLFKVLFVKRVLYTYRRWILTSVSGIATIGCSMLIMLIIYSDLSSVIHSQWNLSLSAYKDKYVYYRAGDQYFLNLEPIFANISKRNQAIVREIPSKNILIDDLLKLCTLDYYGYKESVMIAGDFNQNNSTILYNSNIVHAPAIAINLYTNALLQKLSRNNELYISTVNEPIKLDNKNADSNSISYYNSEIIGLWIDRFTPCLLYLVGQFMAFPLEERVGGIKQQQFMTKLSPIMYWTVCFLWDYICYTVVIVFSLITIYLFDTYNIFLDSNAIWVLTTLLLIYGWSSIFFVYVISFFSDRLTKTMLPYITINSCIGLIMKNDILRLNAFIYELNKITIFNTWNMCRYIVLMIPHLSYLSCITGFIHITWENTTCKLSKIIEECKDYANFKPKSYFVFRTDDNKYAILEETFFLLFSSILYIVLLVLFEYKIFARLYHYGFNKIVDTGVVYKSNNEDPDVGLERDKVNAALSHSNVTHLFIVKNLVKKFGFKFTAVQGINFSVSPGECFGLLGVNGAGKTTTLRILTGDILPSKGDAFIQTDNLYKLSSDFNRYVSMVGYCPQFDAINDQLTGYETLNLMAILRGISPSNSEKLVNKWIKYLGLEGCKDRLCQTYSGGDKRKLNTAMALIGDPPVVFLDEPTSGVDPASRRILWQLLAESQRGGQAIILASQSMDECEALCNRLTIMVDGVMKCIGNPQYLKNRYAQGFTVMVKLQNNGITNLALLKANIERQFTPDINLKGEHTGLLHYHITNSQIPLSEIFGKMKKLKENYPEIEDYTISDTTLEQIFIAFAKKQEVRHIFT